ncbi:hypothetical protein PMAYCL1PPCAC_27043 [Pristionchus mayeri]|uniref:THAP-type domain-containing protein n=1 Tax=Pristionchus mayeri TaxID=1317129 RepID=A0AAN5I8S5_9BILA|nr:hypothetical protein PMAYCL1PPCAC_27043 [Pristionchus mayeri]
MERCIFCGWNRRTAFPSVRFFTIPREPGLKQLMWMKAIDKKFDSEGARYKQSPNDRVCSVHFRQGRTSNDMTHEDFAPHLYLTSDPPAQVLDYLETLAESKGEEKLKNIAKLDAVQGEYKARLNPMQKRIEVSKVSRPSILQRQRKQPDTSEEEHQQQQEEESAAEGEGEEEEVSPVTAPDTLASSYTDHSLALSVQQQSEDPGLRRLRLQRINRSVIETLGVRPGQVVIIKRRVRKGQNRDN